MYRDYFRKQNCIMSLTLVRVTSKDDGIVDLLLNKRKRDAATEVMIQQTTPALYRYHTAWDDFLRFQKERVLLASEHSKQQYASIIRGPCIVRRSTGIRPSNFPGILNSQPFISDDQHDDRGRPGRPNLCTNPTQYLCETQLRSLGPFTDFHLHFPTH